MNKLVISQQSNEAVTVQIDEGKACDFNSLSPETKKRIAAGIRKHFLPQLDRVMIKEIITRIGTAQWKLDLVAFCERTGFEQDDYGKMKFRQFTDLNKALGHFDLDTLCKILEVDA